MMSESKVSTKALLSWVDVAHRLSNVPLRNKLTNDTSSPLGVIATDAYYSELRVRIHTPDDLPAAVDWLSALFGSSLQWDGSTGQIQLEGPATHGHLPVKFDFSDPPVTSRTYQPVASPAPYRRYEVAFDNRDEARPSVIAFHSIKGGSGCTSSAMALAHNLANASDNDEHVLLIDMDLQAPGLSYLLKSERPETLIAFDDLLALAHADPNHLRESTLQFVAARMHRQRIGGIFVLPAKRVLDDLRGPPIGPEHMTRGRSGTSYALVNLVRRLAKKLGCKTAIVDLDSGLTDTAMPFLTDPSVDRVLVSTPGGQSSAALRSLFCTLNQIERLTGARCRAPFMLLNQLPPAKNGDIEYLEILRNQLNEDVGALGLSNAGVNAAPANKGPGKNHTPMRTRALDVGFAFHHPDLLFPPDSWTQYLRLLNDTGFCSNLERSMRGWIERRGIGRGEHEVSTAPLVQIA